MTCKFN